MNKNKIKDWGVFIENDKLKTYEIKLPPKLAEKVWDFIDQSNKSDLIGNNTNGKLNW